MKRDMDYVRSLLLQIEKISPENSNDLLPNNATEEERKKLNNHLRLLVDEAKFLSGEEEDVLSAPDAWYDLRLTWSGCDYLDNIRDPEIWRKTQEGAAKVGGFSFDIVGALAKGLIKKQIEKHTGVELDI